MKRINGLLIDLDGTIYKGTHRIAGADTFMARVQELGIPYLYLTNNSSRTPEMVADHLNEMGIRTSAANVFTAAQAAAQYLEQLGGGNKVYMVGEMGLQHALIEAGCELTDGQAEYVVQGIDRGFNYDKLRQAVRQIQGGARYIVTNPDLLLPSEDGLHPGAGSIAAAIQAAAGVDPVIIGKPSAIIIAYALKRMGLDAGDVWVIGDNMDTDIGAGIAAKCNTGLVLTGVTTRANLAAKVQETGYSANIVADDLMSLYKKLYVE